MRSILEIISALMIVVGVSMIVYDVIKGRTAAALRGIAITGSVTHNAQEGESR
jgi:hypothetical protein